MKHLFSILTAVALSIPLILGCSEDGPVQNNDQQLTPDFILNDLDGQPFQLSSTFGQVVLIDFFAPTWGTCQSEVSEFILVYNEFRVAGLVVIDIAVFGSKIEDVQAYHETFEIPYLMLLDNGEVSNAFGFLAITPLITIISRNGFIVYQATGFHSAGELRALIEQVI